jgi:uncharacterized membrane protein
VNPQPPVLVSQQVQHFSGPLPPPELLARYDEIVPGAAERIISKFENQTDHRIKIESLVIRTGSFKEIAGVCFGFIIAMTTIIGGIVAAVHGQSFLGGTLSFAGLALLVGAFVSSKFFLK